MRVGETEREEKADGDEGSRVQVFIVRSSVAFDLWLIKSACRSEIMRANGMDGWRSETS